MWSTNSFIFRIHHYICRCIFSFFRIFNLRKWGTERPNLPLFHKSVINGQGYLWVNKWHHLPNQGINDLRHICRLVISSKETKTEMNTKMLHTVVPYCTLIFCTHNYNSRFYFCFLSLFLYHFSCRKDPLIVLIAQLPRIS